METVKKVKFPIASIFFLLVAPVNIVFGLFGLVSNIRHLFAQYSDMFFVYNSIDFFLIILLALTCIYLAGILFAKKRNALLIGGLAGIIVINFLRLVTSTIRDFRYLFDFEFHFSGFKEMLSFLNNNVFSSFLYLCILSISLIFVILIIKNPEKKVAKFWFIPGVLLAMHLLYESLRIFLSGYYSILYHIVNIIFIELPLVVAFFFLLAWLKNPYKKVKVNQKEEPVQEEAFVRTSNYEGPVVYEGPEPAKTAEPIAKPEPVQKKIVTHTPVSSNSSSVKNVADDLYTLKKLYDDGVLSEEEFAEKKRQLLNL